MVSYLEQKIQRQKERLAKYEEKAKLLKRLKSEATAKRNSKVSQREAVEFRRDQYGLTQPEMAEILGISKGKYSEFVNGKIRLPMNAMQKAYRIGVPAECLLEVV